MDFAAPKNAPRIVDAAEAADESGAPVAPADQESPAGDDRRAVRRATAAQRREATAAAFAAPEGTSWNRVATTLVWYRRTILLATVIPLGAAAALLGWLGGGLPWVIAWAVLAAAAALAGWLGAVSAQRSWGYTEGRTDFYLTYGIIVRQLIVVPYGRMQLVDVTANLLEQAFGIATVRVRTAATTADTRIPGLRLADAVELRDRLAARSETFSTGL